MALRAETDRFAPILEEIALALSRHGIKPGDPGRAKSILRVKNEFSVRRVIQVYWTPFEASVPGRSIGLHLETAEPRVHWTECYLSPEYRNWVFCFQERPDGEIQLAYHADYATASEAIKGFFNLSSWYVLTATDQTWADVVHEISDDVEWPQHLETITTASLDKAIQESLKKSTIFWLRWSLDGREHTMPVWYLYDAKQEKIFVLSGERQQMIPDVHRLGQCEVILRWKGKNAQVAELPASVRVLERGPEWDEVAEKIAEKRLNIPGLPEDTARRWRDECEILELTLAG